MPELGRETEGHKRELCLLEIGVVQANIARSDSNGLQIKTWCATTWSALEAFAIKEELPSLALAGFLVILAFAPLEISYRRFQWRFIQRSKQIEEMLTAGSLQAYEYSVHRSAVASDPRKELGYSLTQANFYLLYVLLSILSALVWWWL